MANNKRYGLMTRGMSSTERLRTERETDYYEHRNKMSHSLTAATRDLSYRCGDNCFNADDIMAVVETYY